MMSTTTDAETATDREPHTSIDQPLQPYRCTAIPGVCFESGHCILAFDFTSTPPGVDPFRYVWIVGPDDDRTLYADPEAGIDLVSGYHTVEQGVAADVTWDQTGPDSLRLTVDGDDGTDLELDVTTGQTGATRVLNVMAAVTPRSVVRSRIGAALVSDLLERLLDTRGTKVAGRTEIGASYRFEADRIAVVTEATATLDGEDLGAVTAPDRTITFGDVTIGTVPLSMRADAFLPIPTDVE